MKVCIVISSIDKSLGGPSRSVPILAKGLSIEGASTVLLTQKSSDMNTHILDDSNVELITIPSKCGMRLLEHIIINGKFDILHLQNLWDPFLHKIVCIARKNNIPYIMTPRGTLEPWCLEQKKLKKKIALAIYQKRDLQNAACIMATSNMEAKNIRNIGIKSPIATIPNGIDVSEYNCRGDKRNLKRQVCFLSRIHPKKGIEILIESWSRIHYRYPDWKIVIAGNGNEVYIKSLNQLINGKGLHDCVTIIPPVFGEDKLNLLYQSALFILPTYSENFGMVIAESMSCGIPVITTSGTPWQELNDLRLGWCVDLSIDNIANAISDALDKGIDFLYDLGQKCSLHIADNYQFKSVAKKNILTYEWILRKNGVPNFISI